MSDNDGYDRNVELENAIEAEDLTRIKELLENGTVITNKIYCDAKGEIYTLISKELNRRYKVRHCDTIQNRIFKDAVKSGDLEKVKELIRNEAVIPNNVRTIALKNNRFDIYEVISRETNRLGKIVDEVIDGKDVFYSHLTCIKYNSSRTVGVISCMADGCGQTYYYVFFTVFDKKIIGCTSNVQGESGVWVDDTHFKPDRRKYYGDELDCEKYQKDYMFEITPNKKIALTSTDGEYFEVLNIPRSTGDDGYCSWRGGPHPREPKQYAKCLDNMDPTLPPQFFKGVAAGNLEKVRDLLTGDKRLVLLRQSDADAVSTAIKNDDVSMLELLVEFGAPLNYNYCHFAEAIENYRMYELIYRKLDSSSMMVLKGPNDMIVTSSGYNEYEYKDKYIHMPFNIDECLACWEDNVFVTRDFVKGEMIRKKRFIFEKDSYSVEKWDKDTNKTTHNIKLYDE